MVFMPMKNEHITLYQAKGASLLGKMTTPPLNYLYNSTTYLNRTPVFVKNALVSICHIFTKTMDTVCLDQIHRCVLLFCGEIQHTMRRTDLFSNLAAYPCFATSRHGFGGHNHPVMFELPDQNRVCLNIKKGK